MVLGGFVVPGFGEVGLLAGGVVPLGVDSGAGDVGVVSGVGDVGVVSGVGCVGVASGGV